MVWHSGREKINKSDCTRDFFTHGTGDWGQLIK